MLPTNSSSMLSIEHTLSLLVSIGFLSKSSKLGIRLVAYEDCKGLIQLMACNPRGASDAFARPFMWHALYLSKGTATPHPCKEAPVATLSNLEASMKGLWKLQCVQGTFHEGHVEASIMCTWRASLWQMTIDEAQKAVGHGVGPTWLCHCVWEGPTCKT